MITKIQTIFIAASSIFIIGIVIFIKTNAPLTKNFFQPVVLGIQSIPNTTITPKIQKAINVVSIDTQYAADFSDDRVLMGASHNVFVGKIVRQMGNKERGIGPETQFEVEVVYNIKGDLKGTVTVDEQGGYENGTLYVVGDDTVSSIRDENGYLLQPGSTYLLATRYNSDENWYTLNSYPTASKLVSSDTTASDESLVTFAESDPRVQQLKVAYQNEVLLTADVAHNNALNSYVSVQAEKMKQTEDSLATSTDDMTPTSTDQTSASSTSTILMGN